MTAKHTNGNKNIAKLMPKNKIRGISSYRMISFGTKCIIAIEITNMIINAGNNNLPKIISDIIQYHHSKPYMGNP